MEKVNKVSFDNLSSVYNAYTVTPLKAATLNDIDLYNL